MRRPAGNFQQSRQTMLRLTEVKLPLDHPARLRRAQAFDIFLVYTLDVEVKDEAALLKRLQGRQARAATPDMAYRFVAQAPDRTDVERPVVIGTGPCGLLAGAGAGPDGLPAHRAGARQGGARAHQGHLGPVAQA
jgi:uncharacterized FAD-dependent dehydrogenase